MLIYVESSAFAIHTFVLQCHQSDTLARIRAHLLHMLYEMGREDHQFRLRFKGQFLRDAYTLEDYHISEHSVLKMVPMARRQESFVDVKGNPQQNMGSGQNMDIKISLVMEVAQLKWRENMMADFNGSKSLNRLFVLFSGLAAFWWFLSPTKPHQLGSFLPFGLIIYACGCGLIVLYSFLKGPSYTHKAGFVGPSSLWPIRFMVIYGIMTMANWAAAVGLATWACLSVLDFARDQGETYESYSLRRFWSWFLMFFWGLHALYLFIMWTMVWSLVHNFRFEIGDLLERHLIITRDVEKVIQAAKGGRVKEQRNAAFELATLTTTGDDGKFRIVAEGGLEALISLGLSRDEATQEYATEAIAEMLTVPAIQDQFVELGGVGTLTTLLHSNNERVVQEAATALSYIVSDTEENRQAVVADRGLEDIAHAARNGTESVKRYMAGVFLDLAFSADVRAQMAAMNTPTGALVDLCTSSDPETLRLALQTLELIALESSDVIFYQDNLLDHLMALPTNTMDSSIYLLAGKILLYYAENPEACEKLLNTDNLKDTLTQFAKTKDPVLQKVVAKVILSTFEDRKLAQKAKDLNLKDILAYIRSHSGDRDAWNMADEGISLFDNATEGGKYKPAGIPAASSGSMSSLMKLRDLAEGTKVPEDVKMPLGSTGVLPRDEDGGGRGSRVSVYDRPGTSAMGSHASVLSKSTEGTTKVQKDVQL
ncbi:uncharacterized protein [Amphiura filiformis]|uniref:uncharacterized protein n=1 Tax=Amphiura filiformis TaxID=82378 RepID=UPI003B22822D